MRVLLVWFTVLSLVSLRCVAGTLAQFRTVYGEIDVELYDTQKPGTVRNFKRLVESGAYENTFFHRLPLTSGGAPIVAQGGGFFVTNAGDTNYFGPPWALLGLVPNFGNISNEFSIGPRISNTNGTIAMAKLGGNPDSATSQWFFNMADNSANFDNQNGGFTVFGHVLGGTNAVLNLFSQFSYFNGIQPMNFWYPTDPLATNLFTTLPVTYSGPFPPRYEDLFYVDITLLFVQVASSATGDQRQISWNSVAGRTNFVEYTTVMPPAWYRLLITNGTGARFTATDPTPTNAFRFYRVRVGY
jgi:cyclophilin family peptidyl-prolyl cis-trans isomerase